MDGHTVLAALTQEVLIAASALGVDTEGIVKDAGLDSAVLADPDGRVPLQAHFRMWELLSKKPIGLELGARLGIAGMGVIGYAMQHGATVGDALAFQRRYRAVLHPDVVPTFERRDDANGSRVVFTRRIAPPFIMLREPVEAQASAIVAMMRRLIGDPLRPAFVALPLSRPAEPSRQEKFFQCPVAWSASALEVAFDAALLDAPLPRSDAQLFGYLARRAADLHAALPPEASWAARARREIGLLLAEGEPRLPDVAKRLGVSERTLHRRLEGESTNFASLVDEARRERALLLIADPALSASELAFLLGYSEPAAFFRAFKRWTGETPKSYRNATG
ncbi:MAG: AraC family transcriptional regulator [Labilithrix sp.]|nr:AraC family transcriptional regulator [Labilithrix sp.]MCW5809429.1 AraC family transcriptional regulator [Labilithrix sp.]